MNQEFMLQYICMVSSSSTKILKEQIWGVFSKAPHFLAFAPVPPPTGEGKKRDRLASGERTIGTDWFLKVESYAPGGDPPTPTL